MAARATERAIRAATDAVLLTSAAAVAITGLYDVPTELENVTRFAVNALTVVAVIGACVQLLAMMLGEDGDDDTSGIPTSSPHKARLALVITAYVLTTAAFGWFWAAGSALAAVLITAVKGTTPGQEQHDG